MKKFAIYWLLALGLLPSLVTAQNLIPNPGFENLGSPPCSWITSPGGFTAAVNNWTMPSNGSTDIFSTYVSSTCFGHPMSTHSSRIGQQMPRTGNVSSALLTYGAGCGYQPNYREYLQAQLTTPMVAGQAYDVEFYVSLGDAASLATNNLGAHFRTGPYFQATCFVISPTPQFNNTAVITNSTGWTLVSGTVTATANWTHVIFGNFFTNAATATASGPGANSNTRYFIDDVSVQPSVILPAAEVAFAGQRSQSGSVELSWDYFGSETPEAYRLQRSTDGLNWEDIARPAGTASAHEDHFPPRGELLYRLRYKSPDGSQYSSETVAIAPGEFPYEIHVAPNPVSSSDMPITLRVAHGDEKPATVELYDLQGRLLHREEGIPMQDLDGYRLNSQTISPGIYFARVTTGAGAWSARFLVQ